MMQLKSLFKNCSYSTSSWAKVWFHLSKLHIIPFTTFSLYRIKIFCPNYLTFQYYLFAIRNNNSRDSHVTTLIFKVGIKALTFYLLKSNTNVSNIFSLSTVHKIALSVKNIDNFTSEQCHFHKCLIEIWVSMAQLFCWSVLNISCKRSIKWFEGICFAVVVIF